MTHVSCRLTARDQRSFSVQTTAALAQRGNIVIIVVTAMSTLRWLTRSLIKVQVHIIRTNFNFPSNEGPKSACMYIYMYIYIYINGRLVLSFWYRLTRVVPDKGPLNGCVCVSVSLHTHTHTHTQTDTSDTYCLRSAHSAGSPGICPGACPTATALRPVRRSPRCAAAWDERRCSEEALDHPR